MQQGTITWINPMHTLPVLINHNTEDDQDVYFSEDLLLLDYSGYIAQGYRVWYGNINENILYKLVEWNSLSDELNVNNIIAYAYINRPTWYNKDQK